MLVDYEIVIAIVIIYFSFTLKCDRTSEEWINQGIINGVRYPLPATVFVERVMDKKWIYDRDDNTLINLFGWFHAAVTDYDYERKLWTIVTLDGLKRKFLLPRIYVQFFGEDPRNFAKRIIAAIKGRQIAETNIRLIYYIKIFHNFHIFKFCNMKKKNKFVNIKLYDSFHIKQT